MLYWKVIRVYVGKSFGVMCSIFQWLCRYEYYCQGILGYFVKVMVCDEMMFYQIGDDLRVEKRIYMRREVGFRFVLNQGGGNGVIIN